MNNFDEVTRTRYSQMQNSILNKSGSSFQGSPPSNKLNLISKFALLEEATFRIESDAHALTQAARESARMIQQMKRVVGDKELGQYRQKCWEEVKKYERTVSYGIAENDRRTEQLHGKCKGLNQSTEDLKTTITMLHTRINRLESVLGYYSGAQIVSNY